jgi:hypothetical protein
MLRMFWANLSTVAVQLRECMVRQSARRRRVHSTEEVVADLHTYLEQLNAKCGELEAQTQTCQQRALFHRKLAKAAATEHCKQRELNWGKLHLQDKHRLQNKLDRMLRCMHLIRQQIDSLTSSQMDNIMLDAMRQYNMTAKCLGLPDKSRKIEALSSDLQERFTEVEELQHLMSDATDSCALGQLRQVDDEDLMAELAAIQDEAEADDEAVVGQHKKEERREDNEAMEAQQRLMDSRAFVRGRKDPAGAELRQRVTAVLAEEEMMPPESVPLVVASREEEALLV